MQRPQQTARKLIFPVPRPLQSCDFEKRTVLKHYHAPTQNSALAIDIVLRSYIDMYEKRVQYFAGRIVRIDSNRLPSRLCDDESLSSPLRCSPARRKPLQKLGR